jgi:hypothetical protein
MVVVNDLKWWLVGQAVVVVWWWQGAGRLVSERRRD